MVSASEFAAVRSGLFSNHEVGGIMTNEAVHLIHDPVNITLSRLEAGDRRAHHGSVTHLRLRHPCDLTLAEQRQKPGNVESISGKANKRERRVVDNAPARSKQ
jgi:hypothetical protein